MELDRDICYRALSTRDPRFYGRFYTCVLTTGIYCRPICPVPPPKPEHCLFLVSAAAAQAAGFRPCLRCRPEVAPGLAGWRGTANTVSRALALIAEGALDGSTPGGDNVERLADRLGVGTRHLRRLFARHLGAAPIAVARAQRLLFAKQLITETALPLADVALAAGFGSIRRFNAVMRETYGRAPGQLRRAPPPAGSFEAAGITLKLPYTTPYDQRSMMAFLGRRAIPGVEAVRGGRYHRTVAVDCDQEGDQGVAQGTIEVTPADGQLLATIRISQVTALANVVGRLRRLFDLDAEITAIESHLARDPRLAPAIAAHPGLRVPGAWDAFELAVRAILGQQVSVTAARTLAGRLAAAYGTPLADSPEAGPSLLFPRPAALAAADLTTIGLPGARARAISGLARAVLADRTLLRPFDTLDVTVEKLCDVPGIGPWTAHYIAMRALSQPDAFPAADLGLLRAAEDRGARPTPVRLIEIAEPWRPWRAYAALHLWMADAAPKPKATTG